MVRDASAPATAILSTWPLRHLVLRTPRLELRPDDDAGLLELVEVALPRRAPARRDAVHVPVDRRRPGLPGRGALQYFWSQRAQLSPERWSMHFLVRLDGRVVGMQSVTARLRRHPRDRDRLLAGNGAPAAGDGTEMRAAVLPFAFDHLGAGGPGCRRSWTTWPRTGCRRGWATAPTAVRRWRAAGCPAIEQVHVGAGSVRPAGVDGRGVRRGRLLARRRLMLRLWSPRARPRPSDGAVGRRQRRATPCATCRGRRPPRGGVLGGSAQVDAAGERVAPRRVAGLVSGAPPALTLGGAAVGELAPVHPPAAELGLDEVVADAGGRVQRGASRPPG